MAPFKPAIPALLSPRAARNALLRPSNPDDSTFNSALYRNTDGVAELDIPEMRHMLDALAQKHDILAALDTARRTGDPTMSPEGRALAFKANYTRAMTTITDLTRKTAAKLMDDRAALRREAFGKAGLTVDYGNRSELLAVLRSMSEKDRNAAIDAAIKTGDRQVLSAINGAHELLVGPTSIPVNALIEQFVAEQAPIETLKIAKLDEAEGYLEMAYSAVAKTAEEMRDLPAEERGEAGVKAAREAEAALALALSDLHPGERGTPAA